MKKIAGVTVILVLACNIAQAQVPPQVPTQGFRFTQAKPAITTTTLAGAYLVQLEETQTYFRVQVQTPKRYGYKLLGSSVSVSHPNMYDNVKKISLTYEALSKRDYQNSLPASDWYSTKIPKNNVSRIIVVLRQTNAFGSIEQVIWPAAMP